MKDNKEEQHNNVMCHHLRPSETQKKVSKTQIFPTVWVQFRNVFVKNGVWIRMTYLADS